MGAPNQHRIGQRWIYAAKPASWPKLLLPALLGQAIGVAATGTLWWPGLGAGLAFTVFDLLFVVFLNDVGDAQVDRIKREMFPDACSPKTIPDGILSSRALVTAGLAAGLSAIGVAWAVETWLGRPGLGLAAIVCLLLFVGYTFPPIQLNYRGGGERLEMLGVGVALPWFNAYLQGGDPLPAGLWLLPGFALLSLASAIASGLSDEQSDRLGGKITYATAHGNPAARRRVEWLVVAAALTWVVTIGAAPVLLPSGGLLAITAVIALGWRRMRALSDPARTNAFAAQARYKQQLHRVIWRATTLVAMLLMLRALVLGVGRA